MPVLSDLRLTAVRQFKILGSIVPGETIIIEAKIDGALDGVVQVSGTISNQAGAKLAMGSVVLGGRL